MKLDNKNTLSFIIFLLIILTCVIFFKNSNIFGGNPKGLIAINGKTIVVEKVFDSQKMELGLGKRKNICQNCGMLFVFPGPGKRSFWMKDMQFDLDILWLNNKKIVHIEKNVSAKFAGILSPDKLADQVLEIPAGFADKIGIKEGDLVKEQ